MQKKENLSAKEIAVWRWCFAFWIVAMLSSMAGMSIGGGVMVAAALYFSYRLGFAGSWKSFSDFGFLTASLVLFAVSLVSVLCAWIWPPLGLPLQGAKELFKFHYLLYPFAIALSLVSTGAPGKGLEDHGFWRVLFWMGLIVSAVAFIQFWGGYFLPGDWLQTRFFRQVAWSNHYHAQGFMMFHLSFASAMGFMVSYAGARLLWKREWLWGLLALLSSCAMAFTYSRIAFVALGAAWVTLGFLRAPKLGLIIGALSLLTAVLAWNLSPSLRTRFADNDGGFHDRRVVWASSMEMFRERPLFGVGYGKTGQFSEAYSEKIFGEKPKFASHAHNNFIDALASTGIFGFFAFLAWWGILLLYAFRAFRASGGTASQWLPAALLASAVAFQVNGLTQVNFNDAKSQHSLMLWAGLCVALEFQRRRAAAKTA